MRKVWPPALVAALIAGALWPPAAAAEAPRRSPRAPVATTQVFAAGGTHVSNGVFFPGTVVCLGTDCQGQEFPLMVPRGNDIEFVNLDPSAATNCHQIQSYKRRKKTGRPLFQSDCVSGPGTDVMVTSHLKPGIYEYQCTTHYGMRGIFEIT